MRFGGRLLIGFVALVTLPLIAVPSACVVRDEDEDHEWDDDDEGDDDEKKGDAATKRGTRIPAAPGAAGAGAQSDAAEQTDANAVVDATESDATDPFANPCSGGRHPYMAGSCAAKANKRCFDSVTLACLCECGTEPCFIGVPCSEPISVYPWTCAPVVSCGDPPDAGSVVDASPSDASVDASVSDAAGEAATPAPSGTAPSSSGNPGAKFRIPAKRIPPPPEPNG